MAFAENEVYARRDEVRPAFAAYQRVAGARAD
jgi:hypothetical protein